MTRPPMVFGMPEKSGKGSATLTSAAEGGQATGPRSSARGGPATVRTPDAVAGAAQLACVLEVSAEKPGNITPSHDFHDTTYEDMLRSAIAIGPELGRAGERGVGDTVLAAVRATRRVAGSNTNLGIALLLAPLARAALTGGGAPLPGRVEAVLGGLTLDDASAARTAASWSRSGPAPSAALASGASSSAIPRFVFACAARRDARTTASTVSPTPRSPARASSGPIAIALRSMSSKVVSRKSWRGVMLPGFSALTSSTQASCAAPATPSAVRTVVPPVCAEDPRRPA